MNGLTVIDTSAPARISEYCDCVEQPERQRRLADDERELADLAQAGADDQRGARRIARTASASAETISALPTTIERDSAQHLDPVFARDRRVDEHADRHEEEHGERVAERQQVGADLVAERRLADDDAGDERAERERHAEDAGRRRARCRAPRSARRARTARATRAHDASQQPGHARACRRRSISATNSGRLADGERARPCPARSPAAAPASERQQHEDRGRSRGLRTRASRRRRGRAACRAAVVHQRRAAARPCWRPTRRARGRRLAGRRPAPASRQRVAERGGDRPSG